MFEISCSLEIFGKPKEAVEMTLKELVERVKLREEIEVKKESYEKAVPMEKTPDFFIASVELILKIGGFEALAGFVVDFGPAQLEILKPHDKITLDVNELESGLNEALIKIQELDKRLKVATNLLVQEKNQNKK